MTARKAPLIALVATAVLVDGQRRIVQPGQPLPELQEPDTAALLAARAVHEPRAEEPPQPAAAAPAPAAAPVRAKR